MNNKIISKAFFMIMLIIMLPMSIPIALADEPLSLPADQCIDKFEEGNDYIEFMDNGVIRSIEAIASILYFAATIVNTIDSIADIVGLLTGVQGPTPEATCCVNIIGELGVCEANYGWISGWKNFKSTPFISGVLSIATCECCSGQSGDDILALGGVGGICPLGNLANDFSDLVGGDPLGIEGAIGTEYNNPNAGSGVSQFHASAFENIYMAAGCLCPVAILHNLRKLKTIYMVHNCCVEEACKNGRSTEVCEKQLDEATCMYWEGSILRTIVTVLASIIAGYISGFFVKVFEETIAGEVATCVLLGLDIIRIPYKIQSLQAAFDWMDYSFSDPTCSELNFDDIDDMFDPNLNREQRDLTMYENKDGIMDTTFEYEPIKLKGNDLFFLKMMAGKDNVKGDAYMVKSKNKFYYYSERTFADTERAWVFDKDTGEFDPIGITEYEKIDQFEAGRQKMNFDHSLSVADPDWFGVDGTMWYNGEGYYLMQAEGDEFRFESPSGQMKIVTINALTSNPEQYGYDKHTPFTINGVEITKDSTVTSTDSGWTISTGTTTHRFMSGGVSMVMTEGEPAEIFVEQPFTANGQTSFILVDSGAQNSLYQEIKNNNIEAITAIQSAAKLGWSDKEINNIENWKPGAGVLEKTNEYGITEMIYGPEKVVSYIDQNGLTFTTDLTGAITSISKGMTNFPISVAQSMGMGSQYTGHEMLNEVNIEGNTIQFADGNSIQVQTPFEPSTKYLLIESTTINAPPMFIVEGTEHLIPQGYVISRSWGAKTGHELMSNIGQGYAIDPSTVQVLDPSNSFGYSGGHGVRYFQVNAEGQTVGIQEHYGSTSIQTDSQGTVLGVYVRQDDGNLLTIPPNQQGDFMGRNLLTSTPLPSGMYSIDPTKLSEVSTAAQMFTESGYTDVENVNYANGIYLYGTANLVNGNAIPNGLAIQFAEQRITKFEGDGAAIVSFELQKTDMSGVVHTLSAKGRTTDAAALNLIRMKEDGKLNTILLPAGINSATSTSNRVTPDGIPYKQIDVAVQNAGTDNSPLPLTFEHSYDAEGGLTETKAYIDIGGFFTELSVDGTKVSLAGTGGLNLQRMANQLSVDGDIESMSNNELAEAINDKLQIFADEAINKAKNAANNARNELLKQAVEEQEQKRLKELKHRQAQKIAYDVVWEMLDFALAEYAFPLIDEMCKSDWESSEPTESVPMNTQTTGGNVPEGLTELNIKLPPGTTQAAKPCADSSHAEIVDDRVTYSLTSCSRLKTFRVFVKVANLQDMEIDSGVVAEGTTFSEDIKLPGKLDRLSEVCIEADSNIRCY